MFYSSPQLKEVMWMSCACHVNWQLSLPVSWPGTIHCHQNAQHKFARQAA